ncbi:UDP-N-acetylglucosamine transporter-like isoform X2 [Octopus sinensis]|uniref:UDP-N-acetylglucosamine transporter-like isoform X2 n=1 Tax=Octopus sinensis TaxID=2607531 RepID=A0A7E6FLU9_9MOLL|nr:UDP-N-acetylglucosamine transporter-like isoform X2 [Octopus sinensis]
MTLLVWLLLLLFSPRSAALNEGDPAMTAPSFWEKLFMKVASLVAMTVLNSTVVLLMRYLRMRQGPLFISTTAVVMCEVFKLFISMLCVVVEERNLVRLPYIIYDSFFGSYIDTLKMMVPSFLYTLQNNLFFVAISNLDVATVQVLYQLRIFTTCLFAVIILGKEINRSQGIAIVMLFVGVCVVQLNLDTEQTHEHVEQQTQNNFLGVIAIVVSVFLSGFAGVYFEKVLKSTSKSVWIRNIQLASYGIFLGFIGIVTKDGATIAEKGFFFGYDNLVLLSLFIQAFAGLSIAVVFKYADNVLKSFASSMSIIISCVAAVIFFKTHLTPAFYCGTFFVICSLFLYNR